MLVPSEHHGSYGLQFEAGRGGCLDLADLAGKEAPREAAAEADGDETT